MLVDVVVVVVLLSVPVVLRFFVGDAAEDGSEVERFVCCAVAAILANEAWILPKSVSTCCKCFLAVAALSGGLLLCRNERESLCVRVTIVSNNINHQVVTYPAPMCWVKTAPTSRAKSVHPLLPTLYADVSSFCPIAAKSSWTEVSTDCQTADNSLPILRPWRLRLCSFSASASVEGAMLMMMVLLVVVLVNGIE